jgi:hypothetical protein
VGGGDFANVRKADVNCMQCNNTMKCHIVAKVQNCSNYSVRDCNFIRSLIEIEVESKLPLYANNWCDYVEIGN